MPAATYETSTGKPVHVQNVHYLGEVLSLKRFAKTWSDITGINAKLALVITGAVGTMWCAYLFTVIALIGLPEAIKEFSHGHTLALVAWVAQTFLQLVLLSIILVGQNLLSLAAERRAEKTLEDGEYIRNQVDEHTDGGIKTVLDAIQDLSDTVAKAITGPTVRKP